MTPDIGENCVESDLDIGLRKADISIEDQPQPTRCYSRSLLCRFEFSACCPGRRFCWRVIQTQHRFEQHLSQVCFFFAIFVYASAQKAGCSSGHFVRFEELRRTHCYSKRLEAIREGLADTMRFSVFQAHAAGFLCQYIDCHAYETAF